MYSSISPKVSRQFNFNILTWDNSIVIRICCNFHASFNLLKNNVFVLSRQKSFLALILTYNIFDQTRFGPLQSCFINFHLLPCFFSMDFQGAQRCPQSTSKSIEWSKGFVIILPTSPKQKIIIELSQRENNRQVSKRYLHEHNRILADSTLLGLRKMRP